MVELISKRYLLKLIVVYITIKGTRLATYGWTVASSMDIYEEKFRWTWA